MFKVRDLSVHAFSNGHTLWCYKTRKDKFETIMVPNYFRDAADMLSPGDTILIVASDGQGIRAVTLADVETVVLGALL